VKSIFLNKIKENKRKMSDSGSQKNRCFSCKKKIGLLGIECKCNHTFCTSCRYAEKHGCSYDYYTTEREILRVQNPKVCAEKLIKVDNA
jgi:hypothetical protein